jgi:hypothetical protein
LRRIVSPRSLWPHSHPTRDENGDHLGSFLAIRRRIDLASAHHCAAPAAQKDQHSPALEGNRGLKSRSDAKTCQRCVHLGIGWTRRRVRLGRSSSPDGGDDNKTQGEGESHSRSTLSVRITIVYVP